MLFVGVVQAVMCIRGGGRNSLGVGQVEHRVLAEHKVMLGVGAELATEDALGKQSSELAGTGKVIGPWAAERMGANLPLAEQEAAGGAQIGRTDFHLAWQILGQPGQGAGFEWGKFHAVSVDYKAGLIPQNCS